MLLFVPGYTLTSALFPKIEDLGRVARIALSFGLGIAVVPLICLALNYTPWGIRLVPVAASLAIFTLFTAAAAYWRRACSIFSCLTMMDRLAIPIKNVFTMILALSNGGAGGNYLGSP